MFNKFLSFILALSFSATLFFTGIKEADASITIGRPPTNNLGLVGYWTMDGGDINWATGTITDRSGNGNTGQLTNMSTTTSPAVGKIGQALSFDGVDDIIRLNGPTLTNTHTITLWIYIEPSQTNSTYSAIFMRDTASPYPGLLYRGNVGKITYYNGGNRDNNTVLENNKWYHVVAVVNSGNLTFYLNGNPDGTYLNIPGWTATVMGNNRFNESFNGKLDDVRIYNRALSADEVGRLYNSGQARVVSSTNSLLNEGLVVRYFLDEAGSGTSPTQINDSSGNDYHLTEINYGSGNMSWTEVTGNRGLESTSVTGTQRARRGITASAGDTIYDAMHGTQKATVEVVVKLDSSTANVSRVFAITDRVGGAGRLGLLHDADGNGSTCGLTGGTGAWLVPIFAVLVNGECFGEVSTAKAVYHIVYDTTQANQNDRVKIYKNGSLQTSLSNTFDQNLTLGIPASQDLIMFNRENSGSFDRSFDGILYYGAIYNHAFTQDDVTSNYNILRYNDDSPKVATVNSSRIPAQSSLNSGLVGHWTFDGKDMNWTTNQALDISGNANHGTLTSMSTTTSPTIGKLGQALRFGGHINVSNESSFDFERTQPFSVSAWVYRNTNTLSQTVISKRINSGNFQGWLFFAENDMNRIRVHFRDTSGNEIGVLSELGSLLTGMWHHVSFTYDGGSSYTGVKIYIDGVDRTASGYGTVSASILNDQALLIGYEPAGYSFNWNGLMDDVRIYNRALSADEVKQLYNLGR